MPSYDFASTDGDIISVYVPLDAAPSERQIQTVDGKLYKRVWSAPAAAHDTRPGSASKEDFNRITQSKNLKVSDMWEISKEMSQARADKNGGHDPVRERYYERYAKDIGKPHKDVIKRETRAKLLKECGIRIED
jgi:hypothetical protein